MEENIQKISVCSINIRLLFNINDFFKIKLALGGWDHI